MDCNFNGHIQRVGNAIRIDAQEIPQRDLFHYLGLIISDREIDEDAKHRIEVG